jgi:hypothetical protein
MNRPEVPELIIVPVDDIKKEKDKALEYNKRVGYIPSVYDGMMQDLPSVPTLH